MLDSSTTSLFQHSNKRSWGCVGMLEWIAGVANECVIWNGSMLRPVFRQNGCSSKSVLFRKEKVCPTVPQTCIGPIFRVNPKDWCEHACASSRMSQLAAKSAMAPDSLAKSTASIAESYFREFSTAGDGCNPFDEQRCVASFLLNELWSWEKELGSDTLEKKCWT